MSSQPELSSLSCLLLKPWAPVKGLALNATASRKPSSVASAGRTYAWQRHKMQACVPAQMCPCSLSFSVSPAARSSVPGGTFFTLSLSRQRPAPCRHREGAHVRLAEGMGFELLHEAGVPQCVLAPVVPNFPCPEFCKTRKKKVPFVVTQS